MNKIVILKKSNLLIVLILLFGFNFSYPFKASASHKISDALSVAGPEEPFLASDFVRSNEKPISVIAQIGPLTPPWDFVPLTPIYQVSLPLEHLKPGETYGVELDYPANPETDNLYKQVFFFDRFTNNWHPLPTIENPQRRVVRAQVPFTFVRLAVLANEKVLATGQASWYAYKGGMFAASPDYAKGSVLRVHNLDNGKFVDVTVNDFGPNRALYPNRVIDLDKQAFQKIASLGAGLAHVKVEPLRSLDPIISLVRPAGGEPQINAWSGILMNAETGEVLWEKDSQQVKPLASLSKLVAAQVFLDTKPDLKTVATYKLQDEEYNYEHCEPWESARLRLKEGDTLTLEDLLYASLVGSANNAVETLVRYSGLTRSEFIKRMNERVLNWGASKTSFIEPTGLAPANVSSPYDYAIISREILKQPLIQKISTTASYNFSTINTKQAHYLKNTNPWVGQNLYNLSGTKTGYLHESLYCLMNKVKTKSGLELIAINFGSPSRTASFSDNEQLIQYGARLVSQ
ncbi:hypothetical protein EOL72_01635 [Candidatus Falkowbacteria bacterium]|jgi:D-alanyl-D-alanine carboxypeptidase|nr:RlpA-like double-psi beta-barrel domain-containing protein [Patescibacteria group bacterium]MDD3435319.1 RlpA-like double-psi beta-barrel domain-containing protein [Patescibacteria group bacterium]MDD4466539.1 RlpA-like double-psi beta-barrel domain-containing protein [Patescibacteria group bacterium]NCU43035.1 hypothetical protein [Candidatus Falkowbacteria bacterium]